MTDPDGWRARLREKVEKECGYQDVACWDRQLRAAGWLPVSARTGQEVPGSTVWRAPDGSLYRGPFGAWKIMRERGAAVHD